MNNNYSPQAQAKQQAYFRTVLSACKTDFEKADTYA